MMHRASKALSVLVRGSLAGTLVGGALVFAIVLSGESASAKSSYDSAYGYDRTWNCALRMVRVDMGFKITEKDDANGYLLFEYKSQESAKPSNGSIELIRGRESDGPVHVVVQLPQMPTYHEQVLVDDLARKLRLEYGEPPQKRRPVPTVDAGSPEAGL